MPKKRKSDPALALMTYPELLEHYRNFSQSVNTGGSYSAGKTDAMLLRDIEAEIAFRQKSSDTAGRATLRLGGETIEVSVVG